MICGPKTRSVDSKAVECPVHHARLLLCRVMMVPALRTAPKRLVREIRPGLI